MQEYERAALEAWHGSTMVQHWPDLAGVYSTLIKCPQLNFAYAIGQTTKSKRNPICNDHHGHYFLWRPIFSLFKARALECLYISIEALFSQYMPGNYVVMDSPAVSSPVKKRSHQLVLFSGLVESNATRASKKGSPAWHFRRITKQSKNSKSEGKCRVAFDLREMTKMEHYHEI